MQLRGLGCEHFSRDCWLLSGCAGPGIIHPYTYYSVLPAACRLLAGDPAAADAPDLAVEHLRQVRGFGLENRKELASET